MGDSIYSTVLHAEDFKGCLQTLEVLMHKYVTRTAGNLCLQQLRSKEIL